MKHVKLQLILVFFILFFNTGYVSAWEVFFAPDKNTPEKFIAVDKNEQKLFVLTNQSPIENLFTMPCSTGQATGNKEKEGDLKTPEGIYFVESVISQGLDFDMYGNLAFTLNYPNPADRVLRKTGSGIWIHGKGTEITPFDSRGCIVLNMHNINKLAEEVSLRLTPVVIARDISWQDKNKNSESIRKLIYLTNRWAEYWSQKSDNYFELYSSESFTVSSERSFNYFKNRKQRLFNSHPWIDVFVFNAKAVEGPGYWVSYFGQFYRTPTFVSAGVKRLYWKEADKGDFKIVGEEWRPWPKGNLQNEYIQHRAVLLEKWLYEWLNSWRKADLGSYTSFYDRDAVQGSRIGKQSIVEHKHRIWDEGLKPEKIDIKDLKIDMHSKGFQITFEQEYSNIQGYSDRGIKEMFCIPYGSKWLIVEEMWTGL